MIAWRLAVHETLPSTSDLCRTLALAGEPEGFAVLARRQTAGRGSRGRQWESPAGNLHLSVLLRPREPARNAAQWALLAAVALGDALAPLLPEEQALALKWPNDVLLRGRKLAGVLAESAATPEGGLEWLVIGIGVNLAVAPEVPGRAAACLAELAAPPAPEALARDLLARLAGWHRRRVLESFAPVRAAWLQRGPVPGAGVTLRLGAATLSGGFAGLGEDGSLLMQTGGRVRAFTAGEVLV
jgi:BirA family biotin operon repressor/biotin-[acetyl-CoA-carboxylase] ligase